MNYNYINIAFFKKHGIKYKARLNREVKGPAEAELSEYWWSLIPKQIQPSFQDSYLSCVHLCVCELHRKTHVMTHLAKKADAASQEESSHQDSG